MICETLFPDKYSLNSHISINHDNSSQRNPTISTLRKAVPQKCDYCDSYLSGQNQLLNHQSQVHNMKSRHKCQLCEKDFSSNEILKSHWKVIHENQKNKCEICGKFFKGSAKQVTLHMRDIHEREKKYRCDICEKKFLFMPILKRHFREIHDKIRNHECKICMKKFPSK